MPSELLTRQTGGWRAAAPLISIWLACTALNLTKAVHIDDTAHLEIAVHILRDPLHPMAAPVFWSDAPAPAHELNQPHLFFFVLAGLLALADSALLLHLGVSIFTAVTIWATWRLVTDRTGRWRLGVFAAAVLGLGPALGPSQNLMTDVPLLALWMLALQAISSAGTDRRTGRIALAGLWIGLACLVKYTSLVLLPVFALWLWRHRRRDLWAVLVPLAALGAWSAFNLWDYGGIHLLGRRISVTEDAPGMGATVGLVAGRGALWILTLGAICPFTVGFAARVRERFGATRVLVAAALLLPLLTLGGQLLAAYGPDVLRGETLVHSFLRGLFFLNGVLVIALVVGAYRRRRDDPVTELLALWIAAAGIFIVVLSPFVAVRHVLLVLPPVLALLLGDAEARPRLPARAVAVGLSLAIGLGVGIADWRIADAYRDLPGRIEDDLHDADRVLYLGHWGFQHYATEAGWAPYVPGRTELAPGDRVVRPLLVDQPALEPADDARLRVRREIVLEAGPLDLFRTVTPRLGYYSVWHGLPWTLTLQPLDRVQILEVVDDEVPRA